MSALSNAINSKSLRPAKGRSLLKCTKDYVCIDLETTGLDSQCDSIIEICATRVVNGEISDRYQTLICPPQEIDPFITQLTGISNDMLIGQPSIEETLQDAISFIGDSLIVGHNVNFDINFLYDECVAQGIDELSNDFVDTMRFARRLFPNLPNYKLKTISDYFGCGLKGMHRAENDVQITIGCYEYMKQHIKNNKISMEELLPIKQSKFHSVHSKDICPCEGKCDESNPFYGKNIVFTGTLERMDRRSAMQYVADIGGINADRVTKSTDFLVLGNNDYCASIKDGKSAKQKKAEQMRLDGSPIEIISERVFYEMLESGE